ncbi:SH3 domain-containing protein [Oribacterium sp. WCC10]|uniref:SH3 domain-containing protein n=1 Tax=Oribacterium sp. WCC10 TaxID=1855343 RepID=UPI0008F02CCE|nr:SH3 domain-containing protein [Oribacterium sp. WCC10]SFG08661.1 SH3 domain-containing protein [Oribacterium sp. WCC10]
MDFRKRIIIMVAVLALLLPVTVYADWGDYDVTYVPYYSTYEYTVTEGDPMYVVLCDVSVSLRTYPTMSSDIVTQVPVGECVTFISDVGNGYLYVDYNGLDGFILADYLDYYEPQTYVSRYGWIVNVDYSASLRSLPSTDSMVYVQIPAGSMVKDISYANDMFYRVTYDGITGYVLQYLVDTESVG